MLATAAGFADFGKAASLGTVERPAEFLSSLRSHVEAWNRFQLLWQFSLLGFRGVLLILFGLILLAFLVLVDASPVRCIGRPIRNFDLAGGQQVK